MGGCASRPKDLDLKAEAVPEAPVSPKEANNVSQEEGKDEGVETQQAGDAPVLDSSEPKKEEAAAVSAENPKEEEMAVAKESEPEDTKVEESKPEETKVEESKPEEPKVEAEDSKSEETKVEAVVKTED